MKVITVSRFFPAYHGRKGEPTYFVEQILNELFRNKTPRERIAAIVPAMRPLINDFFVIDGMLRKLHTIRTGNRFKAGDMASLKVWTGRPYWTSPIEFAQVEIKQTIPINIDFHAGEMRVMIDGNIHNNRELLAKNDGLELADFYGWFKKPMDGQIICWQPVNY